ncbi:PH domain-containing protein [Halorarum halophilum]|uniref:PH domain-containing protein n=1 Tax=Halorarum halophilum TaxID=2743090 RepID=A0A7D5KMB2_9EURY|nr:PH domain-containing protein [Halobaculum halophilum]QLG28175.1 PH domain-containing protein [Halobaculum halophilum]
MVRNNPQRWSTILGTPFVIAGLWLYFGQSQYPTNVGIPFLFFGIFIAAIGVYVQRVSPEPPSLQDNEEIVATRHPTQRVAVVKVVVGFPLLIATVYLLYFTQVPYIYPTISLVTGLFFFSTGLYTYWSNQLTSYYVTTERIIKEYRFLALRREELPLRKVRGVQERKTVTETLVGLGNVRVASGGGRSLEIVMRNMGNPEQFAAEIRKSMAGK